MKSAMRCHWTLAHSQQGREAAELDLCLKTVTCAVNGHELTMTYVTSSRSTSPGKHRKSVPNGKEVWRVAGRSAVFGSCRVGCRSLSITARLLRLSSTVVVTLSAIPAATTTRMEAPLICRTYPALAGILATRGRASTSTACSRNPIFQYRLLVSKATLVEIPMTTKATTTSI